MNTPRSILPFFLVAASACTDGTTGSGGLDPDLGTVDLGTTPTDTGVTPTDMGTTPTDTGVTPTDTGVTPTDTGVTPTDGGTGTCWQVAAMPSPTLSLGDADGAAGNYADPTATGTCTTTTFAVTSNGIPTWEFVAVTPNALAAQSHSWTMPRYPAKAAAVSGVYLGGAIGVTVTGLPIFGPTEAPNDGYRDPVVDSLLDVCAGHVAPGGDYHMHGQPVCLFTQLGGSRRGLIVGFAFDGYPILAPVVCNDAGCTSTTTATSSWRLRNGAYDDTATASWTAYEYVDGLGNLDICNGMDIVGGDYDYAYFATEGFPYYVGCYRGTPTAGNGTTSASLIDYANGGAIIPGGGGGGTPTTCTTDANCTGTCGSTSCVCATSPNGMICAASCANGLACPNGQTCRQNVCRPM